MSAWAARGPAPQATRSRTQEGACGSPGLEHLARRVAYSAMWLETRSERVIRCSPRISSRERTGERVALFVPVVRSMMAASSA
jgi:hypothetical protein